MDSVLWFGGLLLGNSRGEHLVTFVVSSFWGSEPRFPLVRWLNDKGGLIVGCVKSYHFTKSLNSLHENGGSWSETLVLGMPWTAKSFCRFWFRSVSFVLLSGLSNNSQLWSSTMNYHRNIDLFHSSTKLSLVDLLISEALTFDGVSTLVIGSD